MDSHSGLPRVEPGGELRPMALEPELYEAILKRDQELTMRTWLDASEEQRLALQEAGCRDDLAAKLWHEAEEREAERRRVADSKRVEFRDRLLRGAIVVETRRVRINQLAHVEPGLPQPTAPTRTPNHEVPAQDRLEFSARGAEAAVEKEAQAIAEKERERVTAQNEARKVHRLFKAFLAQGDGFTTRRTLEGRTVAALMARMTRGQHRVFLRTPAYKAYEEAVKHDGDYRKASKTRERLLKQAREADPYAGLKWWDIQCCVAQVDERRTPGRGNERVTCGREIFRESRCWECFVRDVLHVPRRWAARRSGQRPFVRKQLPGNLTDKQIDCLLRLPVETPYELCIAEMNRADSRNPLTPIFLS